MILSQDEHDRIYFESVFTVCEEFNASEVNNALKSGLKN